jgi:hypothetical protein
MTQLKTSLFIPSKPLLHHWFIPVNIKKYRKEAECHLANPGVLRVSTEL